MIHIIKLTGVQDDDILLSASGCSGLPFLREEAVVTEKLDGGNCSIHRGKVSAWWALQIMEVGFDGIKEFDSTLRN